MKKLVHLLFVLVLAALICFGVYRYREYKKYEPLRTDLERIPTEDYTAVFFSTYSIEHFTEEDFEVYRGIYPLNASYCIPDLETLNSYLSLVDETDNEIDRVYLGIRPDIITANDLIELMSERSDRYYEVLIAYPSLNYWKNLKEEEFEPTLDAYCSFINELIPLYEENEWMQEYLSVYFYGATEWLVGNSANYESDFGVNEGISHVLSMYMDRDHGYNLTQENYAEIRDNFETLVTECRSSENASEYPDLSNWDVVFFGDSIMAFSETSSIPGAFGGLTGAHIYNCAQGGANASEFFQNGTGIPSIVDRILTKDLNGLSEDSLMHIGMSDYFKHAKKKRQKCFVLDFGMNDYFGGAPVKNDADPYDVLTYSGALRTAVEKLQAAYPDAVILLVSPNFTNYFSSGQDPQSDEGGSLPEYINAMKELSEEKSLLFYNSYTALPIDIENHTEYLADGVHPNEATRFLMAQDLTKYFQ